MGMSMCVDPNAVYGWWERTSRLVHCLFSVDCYGVFLVVSFVYVLMCAIMSPLVFLCLGTILSLVMFNVLLLSVTILSYELNSWCCFIDTDSISMVDVIPF